MSRDGLTRRVLAIALATGLLVGGCTGDPEPVTISDVARPTASAAPSVAPSPTATSDHAVPPERTAAMAEVSAEGAAAAATYAIEVLNFSARSGDPALWESIAATTCRMCTALTEDIGASGPDGDAPLVVTAARGRDLPTEGLYSVELTITQEPSADGSNPGGNFAFFVALSHHGEWVVEAIDIRES